MCEFPLFYYYIYIICITLAHTTPEKLKISYARISYILQKNITLPVIRVALYGSLRSCNYYYIYRRKWKCISMRVKRPDRPVRNGAERTNKPHDGTSTTVTIQYIIITCECRYCTNAVRYMYRWLREWG